MYYVQITTEQKLINNLRLNGRENRLCNARYSLEKYEFPHLDPWSLDHKHLSSTKKNTFQTYL